MRSAPAEVGAPDSATAAAAAARDQKKRRTKPQPAAPDTAAGRVGTKKKKTKKAAAGAPGASVPGAPATGRTVVGLFVHTWHGVNPPGARRVQKDDPAVAGAWAWWGRPAWGGGDLARYTWSDPAMVDYHVDNWKTLGVDFVFLDFTNGNQPEIQAGAHALCARLAERRDGPKVAFWIRALADAPRYRREFYERYPGIFFVWNGKPLLLVNGVADGWRPAAGRPKPPPVAEGFTARWCWGLLGPAAGTMWTFKETSTDAVPYVHEGVAEQCGLAFATQATYMTTEAGRRCRDGGKFFAAQLAAARARRPRIVTITGYNEWMSINLGTAAQPRYTDLWGPECSHDVEPMKGGHGDAYFRQAKAAVAQIKTWRA